MRGLTFDEWLAILLAVQLSPDDLARLREWIARIADPHPGRRRDAEDPRQHVRRDNELGTDDEDVDGEHPGAERGVGQGRLDKLLALQSCRL